MEICPHWRSAFHRLCAGKLPSWWRGRSPQEKSVFIVFFSGQRSYEKVAKICDAYGASRYTYPAQYARRTALLAELQTRIDELR